MTTLQLPTNPNRNLSFPDTIFFKKSVLTPALQELLLENDPQWHLTANFNRTTSLRTARDKLKSWSSFIDRKLFGRSYFKKSQDQRLSFFAFPETGSSSENLHFHLLAKLPDSRHETFSEIAEPTWLKFVPTGSFFVQRIASGETDLQRVISYDLKDIWRQNNYDNFVISSEFAPH